MGRILLVEDNPMDAKIASAVLQKEGHEVHWSGEVHGALELLRIYAIDLVILDWQLPGISGMDMLKSLRRNSKFRNLPVVLVSGKNDLREIQLAIRNGSSDYIIKPMDPLILINKVSRFVNKQVDWRMTLLPTPEVSEAHILAPVRIVAISEIGLQITSMELLKIGSDFEIQLGSVKNHDIAKAQIRVYDCQKIDGHYQSMCTLIGLKEVELQKIRVYIKKLHIDQKGFAA